MTETTTITYKEIEFDIEYNFMEAEPETGSPAEVEILDVTFKGTSFSYLLDDEMGLLTEKTLHKHLGI